MLFLSADVGVGHIAAANAISAALAERDPSVQTRVVDSYTYLAPVVSRVVSEGYLQMVKTIPQMYRFIYQRAERATETGLFRVRAHQITATNLRGLFEREKPDVVVCTHAFPCGAMAEYKKLYEDAPPVAGVVTDFAVHTFWLHRTIDAYAVATEAMREIMIARGIQPDRIHVTGIPVHPRFARNIEGRGRLREKLGLPRDRSVVLMMGGGLGLSPVVKMMQALEDVENSGGAESAGNAERVRNAQNSKIPVCAVVIAGRNTKLESRALAAAQDVSYPLRVLRFVDNVEEYMHAADVLVTKPGGLTSAEALVAGVPMVLFKPLPGQEERNVRYLIERHAAVRAKNVEELTRMLRELLLDPERRERMTAAMREIAQPHAAAKIAEVIENLVPPIQKPAQRIETPA